MPNSSRHRCPDLQDQRQVLSCLSAQSLALAQYLGSWSAWLDSAKSLHGLRLTLHGGVAHESGRSRGMVAGSRWRTAWSDACSAAMRVLIITGRIFDVEC
jgi:hypothetical protein